MKEILCFNFYFYVLSVLLNQLGLKPKLSKVVQPCGKHLTSLGQEERMVTPSSAHNDLVIDQASVKGRFFDNCLKFINAKLAVLIAAPAIAPAIISRDQDVVLTRSHMSNTLLQLVRQNR